jgi:antitoxin YefM
MEPIQEFVPVTKAKATLLDLIRQIEHSDETIAITKNGVPEAVLMSVRKFRGLLETLEILSDEKAMRSIRKSISEAKKEMWVDAHEAL